MSSDRTERLTVAGRDVEASALLAFLEGVPPAATISMAGGLGQVTVTATWTVEPRTGSGLTEETIKKR